MCSYSLPGGTTAKDYTIQASYHDSNGNFADSSDSTHTLTVGSSATSTSASNASASDVDAGVTLSATVSSSAGTINGGSVTFTITDSGNNQVGSPVSGNVSNGSASASFVPTGIAPGTYTITASFHDPAGNLADSSGTGTLTINPGPPTSVTLDPGDTSTEVGTMVTETATVKDQYGNLVADGTTVQWSITGATSGTASVSTQDATTTNGQAKTHVLEYDRRARHRAGDRWYLARHRQHQRDRHLDVLVQQRPSRLTPVTPVLDSAATVTETATVKDQYGNLVADGTTVDFSVSGTNSSSGSGEDHRR